MCRLRREASARCEVLPELRCQAVNCILSSVRRVAFVTTDVFCPFVAKMAKCVRNLTD